MITGSSRAPELRRVPGEIWMRQLRAVGSVKWLGLVSIVVATPKVALTVHAINVETWPAMKGTQSAVGEAWVLAVGEDRPLESSLTWMTWILRVDILDWKLGLRHRRLFDPHTR